MGWSYLAVSVGGAVHTLNVYRPSRNNRMLFGWSFFASWITIELAPLFLVWQLVATVLFARRGALRTPQGKVGLTITLASSAGLLASIRQSFAAREEIREALRDLGDGEPWPEPGAVHTRRGVVFGRAAGRNLKMDIMSPSAEPAPGVKRPVLVQVHGGGWIIGFKEQQGRLIMKRMAAAGWVCCNVDYRLSPAATFPDHLVDVKRAIAWIREHADELGVDPDFVAVTGGSAGGHLTALAALTSSNPELQPGFEDADTSVQVAVPFYGVYDFTNRTGAWPDDTAATFLAPMVMKCDPDEDPDLWSLASPIDQVHEDAPPFLVIHGDLDLLAPVEDAREFVSVLEEVAAAPVHYLELHGAQHAFETFASIRANAVVEAAARYLAAVRSAHVDSRGRPDPEDVAEAVDEALGDELGETLATGD